MGRLKTFKNWFFKGRIEKANIRYERIEILSKEFDEGKILVIGGENNEKLNN